MVQVRERRDGQHVARDLLRPLLHGAGELLAPVAARAAREESEVPLRRQRCQQLRQPLVGRLLPPRRPFEHFALGGEHGRNGVLPALNLDVALRDLLGVVERVAVEERPEELPRDVLERELEVRVLERRVVAGLVDRARERVAPLGPRRGLVLGDDPLGRVAGPRRGDDVLERPREGVDETDLRPRARKTLKKKIFGFFSVFRVLLFGAGVAAGGEARKAKGEGRRARAQKEKGKRENPEEGGGEKVSSPLPAPGRGLGGGACPSPRREKPQGGKRKEPYPFRFAFPVSPTAQRPTPPASREIPRIPRTFPPPRGKNGTLLFRPAPTL